jgi:Fe-S cluster assembly protein SufD
MNEILNIKDWYLTQFKDFENSLNGENTGLIRELRRDAINNFSRLEFPDTKNEEWKYTNISPLLKHNFTPAFAVTRIKKEDVRKYLFDSFKDENSNIFEYNLLVFVNGHFAPELSEIKDIPKGTIINSISEALINDSPLIKKHFGKYADYKNQIFTALSTAYTRDGAFVYIPEGKIIENPIHILFLTDAKDKILIQPRNLFVAGKNSHVTIIEHYACLSSNQTSKSESVYFTNSVTEIVAEENSVVDHIKLQNESKSAFHIARMEVDQERASNFTTHLISFGGDISRNDFNSRFNNEGGECNLNGLFLLDGTQLFDVHTLVDHAKPYCNSREHFKGILDDKSRGVFNGKVMVRRDAQKTNAFQENNNIILSNDALVNTKPQLEIFADDVKCSHGATIGQLDADALFYLKSRGLGQEAARGILLHAFASDVIRTIKVEPIRNFVEQILTDKFDK